MSTMQEQPDKLVIKIKEEPQIETHDQNEDTNQGQDYSTMTLGELDSNINRLIILLLVQNLVQKDKRQIDHLIKALHSFNEHCIDSINELSSIVISKLAFISYILNKKVNNKPILVEKINYLKHRLINKQTDLLKDPLRGYTYYLSKNIILGIQTQQLLQNKQEIKKQDLKVQESQSIPNETFQKHKDLIVKIKQESF